MQKPEQHSSPRVQAARGGRHTSASTTSTSTSATDASVTSRRASTGRTSGPALESASPTRASIAPVLASDPPLPPGSPVPPAPPAPLPPDGPAPDVGSEPPLPEAMLASRIDPMLRSCEQAV